MRFNFRPPKPNLTDEQKQEQERRKIEADRNYDRCAKIKTLPIDVHDVLRDLGHERHYFHSGGETLFFMTKEGWKMEQDIMLSLYLLKRSGDRFPELIPKEDISVYFEMMHNAGKAYFKDHSKAKESMDAFVEAKEKVNELISDLLKEVDKVYHTTYTPTGAFRFGDSRRKSRHVLMTWKDEYERQERKFYQHNGHSNHQGKGGKKHNQKQTPKSHSNDDMDFNP
jgi:hypothetical protein